MVETSHKTGKTAHRWLSASLQLGFHLFKEGNGSRHAGRRIYRQSAGVAPSRCAHLGCLSPKREKVGGGPMIDVGTHVIDLVLWLLNNYQLRYVAAMTYQKLKDQPDLANPFGPLKAEEFTCEDSGVALLVMQNGASVIIETSWLLNTLEAGGVRYLLCGDRAGADNFSGKLRINGVAQNTLYIAEPDFQGSGVSFYEGKQEDSPYREARTFIRAIRGEGHCAWKPGRRPRLCRWWRESIVPPNPAGHTILKIDAPEKQRIEGGNGICFA